MGYRFLDHTSEVAFEAWGKDPAELFDSAAEAVLRTMIEEPDSVLPHQTRTLTLANPELDLLLFDFLQELIYLKDARHLLLRPERSSISQTPHGWTLEANMRGEPLDASRHLQAVDVKAVTLHQFQLEEREEGWWSYVILDV